MIAHSEFEGLRGFGKFQLVEGLKWFLEEGGVRGLSLLRCTRVLFFSSLRSFQKEKTDSKRTSLNSLCI